MKKLILGVTCALSLVTATFAADTTVATVKAPSVQNESLFNAQELGLSLSTGYILDNEEAFKDPYALNLAAGVFYFPWRNFGGELNIPFASTKGVSVQEVQFGVLVRVPLSKTVPVLKNLAPYVGVGGVYNWETSEDWAYIAKGGLEFRFNSKWGFFTEYQWRNVDFDWGDGQGSLQGGLRFVF